MVSDSSVTYDAKSTTPNQKGVWTRSSSGGINSFISFVAFYHNPVEAPMRMLNGFDSRVNRGSYRGGDSAREIVEVLLFGACAFQMLDARKSGPV